MTQYFVVYGTGAVGPFSDHEQAKGFASKYLSDPVADILRRMVHDCDVEIVTSYPSLLVLDPPTSKHFEALWKWFKENSYALPALALRMFTDYCTEELGATLKEASVAAVEAWELQREWFETPDQHVVAVWLVRYQQAGFDQAARALRERFPEVDVIGSRQLVRYAIDIE